MSDTVSTAAEQRPPHLFKPGQSGNPAGRPKGSRNKLGEAFIQALYADFQEHGEESIQKVRNERPHEYLKVIAGILPSQLQVNVHGDLSDFDLDQRIRQLAGILALEVGAPRAASGEAAPTEH